MRRHHHEVGCEQESSLARMLVNADVRHGDEAEVVLEGVGISSGSRSAYLCFCPAQVREVNMAKEAAPTERAKPMPASVHFSRQARRELVKELQNRHGFARLRIQRLVSNGHIHIGGVQVERFEPAPATASVRRASDYEDFWMDRLITLETSSQ